MQVKDSRIKSQREREKRKTIRFLSSFIIFHVIHYDIKNQLLSYLRKRRRRKKKDGKNIPRHNSKPKFSKHERYTANVIAAKFAKLDKLRESYVRLLQGLQKCLMATNLYAHTSVSNTYICMHLRTCVCECIHVYTRIRNFQSSYRNRACIAFYYHSYSLL